MFWNSGLHFFGLLIPNLLFNVLLHLQNQTKKLKLTDEAEKENQRRNVSDEGAHDASHVWVEEE